MLHNAKVTILTEKAINQHYDVQVRRNGIAMDKDAAIARTEAERQKALDIFRRDGQLTVRQTGQQWVIIDKAETPQTRYDKANTRSIALKLNKGTDADILQRLESVDNMQGYIKLAIRNYIKEEIKMNAKEIIENGYYDAAVNLMDDETREDLHRELAPCSDEEFLTAYMIRHKEKYGEDFMI